MLVSEAAAATTPPVQSPVRVLVHRECLGCGYDIWNQEEHGVCSECGREIRKTLAVPVWAWEQPEAARRLVSQMRHLAIGALSLVGLTLMFMVFAAVYSAIGGRVEPSGAIVLYACSILATGAWLAFTMARFSVTAPSGRTLGAIAAALLGVVVVMMSLVLLHESRVIRLRAVNTDTYGFSVGYLTIAHVAILCAWFWSNAWLVSSTRRSVWIIRWSALGIVLAVGFSILMTMVVARVFDQLPRRGIEVVMALAFWAHLLGGATWGIWGTILCLRTAKRIGQLAVQSPGVGAGGASRIEVQPGPQTAAH